MKRKAQQQEKINLKQDQDLSQKAPLGSPRETSAYKDELFMDSPDKNGQQNERQNKGFVTAGGRQLIRKYQIIDPTAGKDQFILIKDDMKVGIEDGEKNLINFDGASNGQGDQWFMENNFSVISRDLQNNVLDRFDADKIMSEQKYFSSPEQSEVEYGLAQAFSPKGKRQIQANNSNGSQVIDSARQKLSDLKNQKRSQVSLDNKFWVQGNIDDKFTERVNTDQDLMTNPLFYQSSNSIGTKMEYNGENKEYDSEQVVPRLNFFNNQNQLASKNKESGQSPLTQQQLRQLLHCQLPNADLLSPPVQWKKKKKLNFDTMEIKDGHNDESDVEKKLDVEYQEEQKLDDKRFGLGVISKMRAQISQKQVKDDSFFMIVEKNSLEKIDSMTGRCLKMRQSILRLITNIVHTASAIISSKTFDTISLIVIIANSVSLALQDPTATSEQSGFAMLDIGFLAFYTTEMVLKILGLGFFLGKGSYLRDEWNVLDFVIVTSSYLPYIIQNSKVNLSSLRSFRVLRPLRTISGIRGLKVIVSCLLASLKLLKDTLVLLVFFFLIFGIAGLQVFSGLLKKQCFEIESGKSADDGGLMFCGGSHDCGPGQFCGKSNFNPSHNMLSFDNILYSLLTCFVTVTLESWTYIMKYMQRSLSFYVFGFSVPLAFLGSFVLQNLTMAVVSAKYKEEFQKQQNDQSLKSKKKKQKMLLDFDNLDDDEKEKLKELQEVTRQAVLLKWKQILLIKQKMRNYVERSRMKRMLEVKKSTQTGFDRLSMLQSPQQLHKVSSELINEKETDYDPNGSSQQQLTLSKFDGDMLMNRNQQDKIQDEKLRISKFSNNKNQNFKLNKHDIISEDDDEYRTEFSNIHGYSQNNQKSGLKGSSPASPFFDKHKKFFNDQINSSDFVENNQKQDKQCKKMILLDSPDKILKMHGIAGQKYVEEQSQAQNISNQISQNLINEPFAINQDFFVNFINGELIDIEKQFTDIQLAQIEENLDIKNAHLFPLIEDIESNEFSDNSIQSNELSTSEEALKLTSNIAFNKNNELDLQLQSSYVEVANSKEYQLTSSISELTLHKDNAKIKKTDSFKQVAKHLYTDDGDKSQSNQQKQSPQSNEDKIKKVLASNKWQNESTTLIIGANNGTIINDTIYTNKPSNNKEVNDKKLATSKVTPFGSGFYKQDKQIKLAGTNTIFRRDVIPIEQSKLNSYHLVSKDIGINKKIYLRKDKFDFEKPAEDIFEKRERQQQQIELENTIKEQTEYLKDWKIKAYQRRAEFQVQQITPDDEQAEYLSAQALDQTDLAAMVQVQYNEPYLSNLYVNGTLSITLLYKKESIITHRTRKLQNNNFAVVEYYEQQASRTQSMNSSNVSRKSTLKSSVSSAVGISPIEFQKTIVMRSIRAQRISQTQQKTLKSLSMIGASSSKQAQKGDDPNEGMNALAQKKAKNLSKQAMKNQKFLQQLIIYRINKDAMRSGTFKILIEKRKARKDKSQFIEDLDAHITDDDDEDEKDEVDFQDTEEFKDDFIDRQFDNTLEIKKAKKQAVFQKRPVGQWSGQDILEDYDPNIALMTAQKLTDIRIWPEGPFGIFKSAQGYVRVFVRSSLFDNFLTMCVFTNVVLLTLDKYPSDPSTDAVLAYFNTAFTYIFISEMSLKIIGLGPVRYLKDRMNYLDGTVVCLSIVEILMSSKGANGSLSAFKSIRIFRIFRILRIARLLRAMKSMTLILGVLMNSMTSFIYLLMLLFLFIFIYTLLGMQLFGGNFNFNSNDGDLPGVPRANYDSFHQAFQAVFDVLTVENWYTQLYDALRSGVAWPITILYLLSWIFLGNWMLLNLFLAILLDGFSIDQTEEDQDETEQQKQEKAQKKLMELLDNKEGEELILYYQQIKSQDKNSQKSGINLKKKKKKKKNNIILDESFEFEKENMRKKIYSMKNKHKDFEGVDCTYAMYFLHRTNKIRIFLYKLQHHAIFEYVILILIIVSSGKLIMDTYIYSRPKTDLIVIISDKMDYAFTALFTAESLIKSLALGFCLDNGSYLREFWNKLDCFIVGTSLLDVALYSVNTPALKVMKILRALRPLRFISHNRDMKTLVNTLAQSIGAIMNVGVVCLIVWSMFAILGINLFSGKLFYCNGGNSIYDYITPEDCFNGGGQWIRFAGHFDNFMQAIITLFTISTFENWPDILHSLEDINDTEKGPIKNNSPINAYFLTAFILVGVFIFLNLFTGVLFMKFEEVQKEEKEATHLTDKQMKWIDIMKMIVNAKPDLETMYVPQSKWRKKVHEFVTGELGKLNKFDLVIMAFIVLNMVLMTLDYETASVSYNQLLGNVNYIFTTIFIIEAILKLIAFGFAYFKSTWNKFDFFIVSTSIFDIVISNTSGSTLSFLSFGPQVIRVLRVLRVSRLFRLVNKYKGLSALIQTLQFSMPQLLNVFALVGLNYFIFAIVANFLFRDITSGSIIDEITNFSNFGYSYLTLIRMSTGEDWNYIMYDCSQTSDQKCIPGVSCGSTVAIPFFIIFMLIQQNIILNLFVLVLCQQFDQYYLKKDNILSRFKDDLVTFKETWTRNTGKQKCIKIKDTQMVKFFDAMKAPLGFENKHPELSKKEKQNYITAKVVKMEIDKDEYGCVYFNELLYKTMRRVYGQRRVKNSIIVENELETMIKIEDIQNKFAKRSRIQEKQEIGSVNPFLLKMFMNISFKAWHKIYLDGRVIQDAEQDSVHNQNIDDIQSPQAEQQSTEKKEENEEEYFYKTDQDISYYSDGEEDSGSDYDDEYDDEGDEDDQSQPLDKAEKSGQIDKDQLDYKVQDVQIMSERFKTKAASTSLVLQQNHSMKKRKNSERQFDSGEQQAQTQDQQKNAKGKAQKNKRRKTVFVPKIGENQKNLDIEQPFKKIVTMKDRKQKGQQHEPKVDGVTINREQPTIQPQTAQANNTQQQNYDMPTQNDHRLLEQENQQIQSIENESGNYSSEARLHEGNIIDPLKLLTKRSRANSLENQSQDQIDENSQLVEADQEEDIKNYNDS